MPPVIHVVHVVESLHRSGRTAVILAMATRLPRSLFRHSVWCLTEGGDAISSFIESGVEVKVWGKRRGIDWRLTPHLADDIRRLNIRLVHSHGADAMLYGGAASKWAGISSLATLHNMRSIQKRDRRSRMRHWLASRMTNTVVAVSKAVAREYTTVSKMNPRRLRVINNGIAWETIDSYPAMSSVEADRILGRTCPELIVGTVAMLTADKDFPTLLNAFKLVVAQEPSAVLMIVGSGPRRAEVENLTCELGLDANVRLLGFRDDVPAILKRLAVFVLSSHSEGLPLAVVEAMGCGCVPIVSHVAGMEDIVSTGNNGILVPPQNPEEMAKAILLLLRSSSLRTKLSAAARTHARRSFGETSMLEQYSQLYVSLCLRTSL